MKKFDAFKNTQRDYFYPQYEMSDNNRFFTLSMKAFIKMIER